MNQIKIYLPPPTNWQDFQSLMKDMATIRYDRDTVEEFGTLGQRQFGVDVFAKDLLGKNIGIQCKESKDRLTKGEVVKEAEEARKFPRTLDLFIIATTAKANAKLQGEVMKLNDNQKYKFRIRVEFWNSLMDDINRFGMVLTDCYRSYREEFKQTDESSHLGCLRIAFHRPAFTDNFQHERNYPDFEEALVATKRLFRTGLALDRWSTYPIVQTVPTDYLPAGGYRKFVERLESLTDAVYTAFMGDKNRINSDPKFAAQSADKYNKLRRQILDALNARLKAAGHLRVDPRY